MAKLAKVSMATVSRVALNRRFGGAIIEGLRISRPDNADCQINVQNRLGSKNVAYKMLHIGSKCIALAATGRFALWAVRFSR